MFTVLYISYNPQKGLIKRHLDNWKNIPEEYRKKIHFILIDDGSEIPISPVIDFPINFTLARVHVDIFGNTSGAKNLGFLLADNDWVFSCEIDHFVSPENYIKMVNLDKHRGKVYKLIRTLPNGDLFKPAHNLFIAHKFDFWRCGGYDEDLAGNHGYDDALILGSPPTCSPPSLFSSIGLSLIESDIVMYTYLDLATGDAEHRQKMKNSKYINLAKVHAKKREIANNTYKHGEVLRFPWDIIKEIRI